MIKKLFQILKPKKKEESDFSSFFREASKESKEKLLLEVARQANQDQRDLVDQYNKLHAKTAP